MRGVMPTTVSAFAILTTIHINNVRCNHMNHSVCKQCGHIMLTEELRSSEPPVCPKCGNKYFTMTAHSTMQFLPHNTVKIKQKDPYAKSNDKLRREHFVGMQENKDGKLMIKESLIDKDSNVRYEFVQDPETGEIVRLCNEKLTDHTDRGYAKFKKKST